MAGQLLQRHISLTIMHPHNAPATFPQLEGPPAVIQEIAGHPLGASGPGYRQIVPLGDADVDGTHRRRG